MWAEKPDHNSGGYTLVELLVVMVLISIMLGVTLPGFRSQMLANDLGQASRLIGGLAQELRLAALREQQLYLLRCNRLENTLEVIRATTPAGFNQQPELVILRSSRLPASVQITGVRVNGKELPPGQEVLRFYPKGFSDGAVIRLRQDDDRELSVAISPFLARVHSYPGYLEAAP